MIRKILFTALLLLAALTSRAQETLLPDSTLHLPPLNNLGQMHYINRWPMSYGLMGYHDWDLHRGLNVNLGASVFTGFGKYAPSGAGFSQNVSGMYALPFNDKLSLAIGGYFLNADWGGRNLRDAGLSAVLGYKFNDGFRRPPRCRPEIQLQPLLLHPALRRRPQAILRPSSISKRLNQQIEPPFSCFYE